MGLQSKSKIFTLCFKKFLSLNLNKNVRILPKRHARMSPEKNVKIYRTKSAKLWLSIFQPNNVSKCQEIIVKRFQERCVTTSPSEIANKYQSLYLNKFVDRFQDKIVMTMWKGSVNSLKMLIMQFKNVKISIGVKFAGIN